MVGERPFGLLAGRGPMRGRPGRQVPYENAEAAPAAVADQRTKVTLVEPLEVGFNGPPVLGEEPVEADDSPTVVPTWAA